MSRSLHRVYSSIRQALSVEVFSAFLTLTNKDSKFWDRSNPTMDSTPVKRSADCNPDFSNPHFKPLWEPDTTVGRNAIKYSLVHHAFQKLISTAGLCTFCTDGLTRRVSEAARRLKAKDLFHNDKACMDLFWQDANDGSLAAGETIVTTNKNGEKIAVADHALTLSCERSYADRYWWSECFVRFQGEISDMDRAEASPSRGVSSWFGCDSGGCKVTPWETRFLAVIWLYTLKNTAGGLDMERFIQWQEKYLGFTHESCQCADVQRLRDGVSFETVVMERVRTHVCRSVWEVIPAPPAEIWRSKARFLDYFEARSSGIRREETLWDYAFSRGALMLTDDVVPRPLPQGWQRRWVSNNTIWYHNSRGNLISRRERYPCLPNVPSTAQTYTIEEEEDLIEL